MKTGKVPHELLARLLARLPSGDPRVVVGPRVGEDAAAIAFGDSLLVATTDPITFATDLIGWYAVHISANDVAVMGAKPRWFLASLLLPPETGEEALVAIFDQLGQACKGLGVSLVGGHSEVTASIERPIVVGCMLGEVPRDRLVTSAGARPGDQLVLAGPIAIEGTALLAREAAPRLRAAGLTEAELSEARALLFDPGISVVAAARAAVAAGGVTALHDPTEGGLATGLRELAMASGVGLEVEACAIPLLGLTRRVCEALGLDWAGLIASGSLLAATRPEAADAVVGALRSEGRPASAIGRVLPPGQGLWLVEAGARRPLPEFARDEVARFFAAQEGGT